MHTIVTLAAGSPSVRDRACSAASAASSAHLTPFLLLLLGSIACSSPETAPACDTCDVGGGDPLTYLDQGWDDDRRDEFYWVDQGTRIVPYDWMLALEQAGTEKLFAAPANMRALGYLYAEKSPSNPDNLPIGFVRGDDGDDGAWLSINCAACHTAEYRRDGKSFRVDGGQGFGNLGGLLTGLADSLQATVDDDETFARFEARLDGAGATGSALRSELVAFTDEFTRFVGHAAGDRDFGHGRTDSLNVVHNSIVCTSLGVEANCRDASVATAVPNLWLTPSLEWVQTNGSHHVPIIRNFLQALGLANLRFDGQKFNHTVNVANLSAVESWIEELTPPVWPEEVFGEIVPAKAEAGRELYVANCESCHSLAPFRQSAPNMFGRTFVEVSMVPMAEVGTDPAFIVEFLSRRADPGPLVGQIDPAEIAADGTVSALTLNRTVFASILGATLKDMSDQEKVTLLGMREIKRPTAEHVQSFKAGPLAGVAMSGYYLHNGSVRTIYQLLLPANQRETRFYVGSREYDPVHLGYVSDPDAPAASEFSTGEVGASGVAKGDANVGHEYGTDLTDDERFALIEFLKTL